MKNYSQAPLADDIPENFNGVLYFSHQHCGVCKVLRPKVEQLLTEEYPELSFHYVDIEKEPKTAAGYTVFTVPVILVFFEGQEFYRFKGGVSIGELARQISRPYELKFG